jgi:glycosyltransferase involved in cell wall biosynthesis
MARDVGELLAPQDGGLGAKVAFPTQREVLMSSENQLRILIELSSSDPRVGAVNDALDLAHYAGAADVRFFVCGPIDAELAELATREGMTVIGACSRIISKRGALPYLGSVLAWIGRLCRIRPHVVHLNYAGWGPSLACAAWILRIPIVARAAPAYNPGNRLNAWAAAYAANGPAHARPLLASPLADRVRVTGDLFRPDRLCQPAAERSIPKRTRPVRFLFLGQLVERKGIALLVEAFARMKADADLLLVGGDWRAPGYAQELRGLIDRLRLQDRVHCENHRQDVAALLEDCDVFVLPSLSEARPRVIIEAMCLGRPVVATAVGGVAEMISDGVTGFLVPPGDASALAHVLDRLAASAGMRARLGEAAREFARREFSPERAVGRYLDLYRKLALEGRLLAG